MKRKKQLLNLFNEVENIVAKGDIDPLSNNTTNLPHTLKPMILDNLVTL